MNKQTQSDLDLFAESFLIGLGRGVFLVLALIPVGYYGIELFLWPNLIFMHYAKHPVTWLVLGFVWLLFASIDAWRRTYDPDFDDSPIIDRIGSD
jgi:hypothetical protein